MSIAAAAAFSHIGLCVADGERAKRFYIEALGFSAGVEAPIDSSMTEFLGMEEDVSGTARFLTHGAVTIELLEFRTPAFIPSNGPRPINLGGLTHLSFRVPDIDSAVALIMSSGGNIVESSRLSWKVGGVVLSELVFCTDPDGNRIELVQQADASQG